MRRAIVKEELQCDRCDTTAVITYTEPRKLTDLPPDWIKHTSHGWGMTGYSRTEELCPKCAANLVD